MGKSLTIYSEDLSERIKCIIIEIILSSIIIDPKLKSLCGLNWFEINVHFKRAVQMKSTVYKS